MIEHIVVDWRDLLDIGIVSFLLYQVIQLLRGSRALAVVSGLGILTFLYFLSRALGLYTLQRALGEMGTKHLFQHKALRASSVEDVASACEEMSKARIGALIVVERGMHLDDMIRREGVRLDARLSRQLLRNIFHPKAPLHDGAVIISRGRIAAAACILPLAEAKGQNFGTRHRAALGITLETDAVAIVVSEERGEISIATNGVLSRNLDAGRLRTVLNDVL